MPRFRAIPIPVSRGFMDPRRFERALENFLDAAAENVRIDLGVTVQTWKTRPEFKIDKVRGERVISTDNLIYKFVSGGTRVRYATMSRDFVPKTRANWIGSGPGRGRRLFVSRKHPRPGIKARRFPQAIIKKWGPRFPELCRRMIAAELGH